MFIPPNILPFIQENGDVHDITKVGHQLHGQIIDKIEVNQLGSSTFLKIKTIHGPTVTISKNGNEWLCNINLYGFNS